MIRAIIFDCFGVLASDGWLPFKRKYFGDDPALFEQAGDLNKAVDSGLAGYDEFVTSVAELAGVARERAAQQIGRHPADDDLFDYIRAFLRPKYKLGMLSNAGANWLPDMFTQEQIDLFDAIALSYESGITKPDPRAYQLIADKLGAQPEECVFIDDQERYCTAAEEVGMRAIVYQSFEQLRTDLEKVLAEH